MAWDDRTEWAELKLIQDSAFKVWQIYINWFTWSMGINLLAASYIITQKEIRADLISGLSVIMIVALSLAIVGGLRMRAFYSESVRRARALAQSLTPSPPTVDLLLGNDIAAYACWAVPAIHAAALVGWGLILVKFGGRPI